MVDAKLTEESLAADPGVKVNNRQTRDGSCDGVDDGIYCRIREIPSRNLELDLFKKEKR